MKTYNEFLLESLWKGTKKLSEEEAIKIALDKCSVFMSIEEKTRISRYVNLYDDDDMMLKYSYVNPKKYDRRSVNTANYYTLVINNDSSWEEYPKRKLIASLTNYEDRYDSNKDYNILPYNDSKWGISHRDDIWWSFPEIKKYGSNMLDGFNDNFNPKVNGFYVSDVAGLIDTTSSESGSVEIWTDDECLLIHRNVYEDFIGKVYDKIKENL